MSTDFLEALFELLSVNKKYPKYQHERRVDLFLNFFLPEILEEKFGYKISLIIPEFPLKKLESASSTNVDYFAYSQTDKVAFMVELKTSARSFDQEQLERYLKAQEDGWAYLFRDLERIHQKTESKEEYRFLLDKAAQVDTSVELRIVYIGPEAMRASMGQMLQEGRLDFRSLEDISQMELSTRFIEEWNVIRKYLA